MNAVYEPSRSLGAKISRRVTPLFSQRYIRFNLERPIISFTFDDCPISAIENGLKPLAVKGWMSTVYIAGSLLGQSNHHGRHITGRDVKALHDEGHEIGGHTFSHLDAQSTTLAAYQEDIDRNQNLLGSLGISPCATFAYPFGQTKPQIKQALESQFAGLRGIQPGIHERGADLNQIKSMPLFGGERVAAAIRVIEQLNARPAWVTFFTHDIRQDHSDWGCSPDDMSAIIAAVLKSGADVLPVAAAIDRLRGQT